VVTTVTPETVNSDRLPRPWRPQKLLMQQVRLERRIGHGFSSLWWRSQNFATFPRESRNGLLEPVFVGNNMGQ
jgi:hypothetical protein